jgi:hypothetical protein
MYHTTHQFADFQGDASNSAHAIVYKNRFSPLSAHPFVQMVPVVDSGAGLVTLTFPCWKGVVGNIVGEGWSHVNYIREQFQTMFPGLDFEAKFSGEQFEVTVVALPHTIAFINSTLGAEIAMANEGIETDAEFVGAVIGKRGIGLRRIEQKAPAECTVYHEDGAFYVKFPADTVVSVRVSCMQYVRSAIYKRNGWLSERLSDTCSSASFSTNSTVTSQVETVPSPSEDGSESSELSEIFSGVSPTPAEAFGN